MMDVIDIAGHFGYFLIFIGLVMISMKERIGWIFRLLGELLWVAIGISIGMSALWVWGLVFIIVDLVAWKVWADENF